MQFYALALLERRRSLGLENGNSIVIHLVMTTGNGQVIDLEYPKGELEKFKIAMRERLAQIN